MKEFIPEGIVPKLGAVLILFYPKNNRIMTLLMRRPDYDGTHAGQISFPGGKFEEADADLSRTAIRETQEETGTDGSGIEVIGKLTDLYIPPSNFHVHPFVGCASQALTFSPDPAEVAELFEIDIAELLDKNSVKTMPRFNKTLNKEVDTPYFEIRGNVVWGATAMMIAELREILK